MMEAAVPAYVTFLVFVPVEMLVMNRARVLASLSYLLPC